MPVEKTCAHCAKKFVVPNRRSDEVKFCSRQCKTEAGWRHLKCPTCGSEFKRKASDIKGQTAYCSRACFDAVKLGMAQAKRSPRYEKVCEQCSKTFAVTKTRVNTARFCSVACKGANEAWRQESSERQQGEKHWRYAGHKYKDGPYKRRFDQTLGSPGEHRLIFAKHMAEHAPGHPFLVLRDGVWWFHKTIHVHHIDGNPLNNDIANLLAVTSGAHAKIHHNRRKPEPWECWPTNPEKW